MRQLLRAIGKFSRDRKGIAAIEFALIAPFLLLLYFGTVDLTNWYVAHRRLVLAGSTIADLTTQSPGSLTGTQIGQFWTAVGDIIAPVSNVNLTMRNFRKNGSTAKQQWSYAQGPTCSGAPNAAALAAIAASEMTEGNDILVAQVCTTIQPLVLGFFDFPPLTMNYQINMRPRLGKLLDCTAGCGS